jgi:hypothetical protein
VLRGWFQTVFQAKGFRLIEVIERKLKITRCTQYQTNSSQWILQESNHQSDLCTSDNEVSNAQFNGSVQNSSGFSPYFYDRSLISSRVPFTAAHLSLVVRAPFIVTLVPSVHLNTPFRDKHSAHHLQLGFSPTSCANFFAYNRSLTVGLGSPFDHRNSGLTILSPIITSTLRPALFAHQKQRCLHLIFPIEIIQVLPLTLSK